MSVIQSQSDQQLRPTLIAAREVSYNCKGFLTAAKPYSVSYDRFDNPYIIDDSGDEVAITLKHSVFINFENWIVLKRGEPCKANHN